MEKTFYIVDVFSEKLESFTGNQLGVFPNAEDIPEDKLQSIARELNFSETTFLYPSSDENVNAEVRIFTPNKELPFAGHPTIGSAFIVREKMLSSQTNEINLKMKVGIIPISASREGILTMTQNKATFGKVIDDVKLVASALNLQPEDIDTSLPIEEVSTGIPFLQIPLKTDKVSDVKINIWVYEKLVEELDAQALSVFFKKDNELHLRVFAHNYGIPEDPATGSNAGCVAAYLSKHLKNEHHLVLHQGKEIGRPSMLYVIPEEKPKVGGYSRIAAKGELYF